ncbi:MAG: hypothetical protein FJ207_06030 [Gemmatimonadetes bacterium]|nr:hypothetical protein [Gemmatimonadota bacterium]
MAGRLSNSFALVKASANVLRLDKELMIFPLMSGIATVLVAASFIAPIFMVGPEIFVDGENPSYAAYALGFLFYLVQYSVIFFFNAALVGAALIRLDGGDPTVSDGLAIASKRMGAILGYAAIAATVGMVLRFIAERAGFLGRIITGLIGLAWTLTTYLTVPILVTKDIGPVDAVKESVAIFKRTWGGQVIGNFGMGWAVTLMAISWTAVCCVLLFLLAPGGEFVVLPLVGLMVLGNVFLALFASALNGIYTAALYRYAITGDTGYFDADIMGKAFSPKN